MKIRTVLTIVLLCSLAAATGCLFQSGPQARFTTTPRFDYPPLEVEFDASASSSSDGIIVGYQWSFGDGDTGSGQKVIHTYYEKGFYPVTLTVTDSLGSIGTASHTVEALNRSPNAAFAMDRNIASPTIPVEFDASDSEDPDGYIDEWIWSFGDATSAEGEVVEHLYAEAGTYTVLLTVVDDDGATDSTKATLKIIGGGCCGR